MAARRVVFVDLETIKLGPLNRAWEYGLIIRDPGFATDQEKLWFVDLEDLNLAMADPAALAIGRFHTRHEQALAQPDLRQRRLNVARERDVLAWVEWWTRTAVLVGWGVSFDAGLMDERMRAHGISPSWHYRLVDGKPPEFPEFPEEFVAQLRGLGWRLDAGRWTCPVHPPRPTPPGGRGPVEGAGRSS